MLDMVYRYVKINSSSWYTNLNGGKENDYSDQAKGRRGKENILSGNRFLRNCFRHTERTLSNS